MLLNLCDHYNEKLGSGWPSNETIARETGLTERGVINIRKRLQKTGLVTWSGGKPGRGHSNHYVPFPEKVNGVHILEQNGKGEPEDRKGERHDIKGERGSDNQLVSVKDPLGSLNGNSSTRNSDKQTTDSTPSRSVGTARSSSKQANNGVAPSELKTWIDDLSSEYPKLDMPKVAEKWVPLCRERGYPLTRESFERFLKRERPEKPSKPAKPQKPAKPVDKYDVEIEVDDEGFATDEYLLKYDDDLRNMPGKLAWADNFSDNCPRAASNWINSEMDLKTRREQIDMLEEYGILVRYTPDINMRYIGGIREGERFGIAGSNNVFKDANGIMRLKGSKHSDVAKITAKATAERDHWREYAVKTYKDAARIAELRTNADNQFIVDTYIAGTPIDNSWSKEVKEECVAINKANGVSVYFDSDKGEYRVEAED